jgi:hypothetical protein
VKEMTSKNDCDVSIVMIDAGEYLSLSERMMTIKETFLKNMVIQGKHALFVKNLLVTKTDLNSTKRILVIVLKLAPESRNTWIYFIRTT